MSSEIILFVTSDVKPGMEEQFNGWYNQKHLPEILACSGFVSASRYEAVEGHPKFLAIYQLDREDALSLLEPPVNGWGEMAQHLTGSDGRVYRRIFQLRVSDL